MRISKPLCFLSAVAAALLAASCIPEQAPLQNSFSVAQDSYEIDDTSLTAKPITLAEGAQERTLHFSDQDWASFTTVAGSNYSAVVSGLPGARVDVIAEDGRSRLAASVELAQGGPSQALWASSANGTVYLRVKGADRSISGPYTLTMSTIGVSGAPTGFAAVVKNGAVQASWIAPASDGGSPITGYRVRALQDTAKGCTVGGDLSCVITGLTAGLPYTFAVAALNAVGRSEFSPSVTVTMPVPGPMDDWTYRRTVTVNTAASNGGAAVTATVTRFPLLVRLTPENSGSLFSQAAADGSDIRFSTTSKALAPYEIEYWNASTRQAAIWVLVDTVHGNGTTNLRMHWGRPGIASASNGPAVFETSNGYVGAWHLGNPAGSGPRPSSVAGAPAAIVRNATAPVSGIIGLAETLGHVPGFEYQASSSPNGRYIELGRNQAFQNNDYAGFTSFDNGFTYSIWIQPTENVPFARVMNLAPDSAASASPSLVNDKMILLLRQNQADPPNLAVRWSWYTSGTQGTLLNGPSYTLGQWTQLVVVKPAGESPVTIYKDGQVYGTTPVSAGNATHVLRNAVWIGRSGSTDPYYVGLVDEVSIANTERSAAFVRLGFETQRAGATSVTFGPVSGP